MKIAVTYADGEVFQHFGHTPAFAVYETSEQTVVSEKIISCGESGHGALADILAAEAVDLLICGGIGSGAINALSSHNIKVIGGASGNTAAAVEAYLNGKLKVRPNFHCLHHHDHGHDHDCGSHDCGSGKCHS